MACRSIAAVLLALALFAPAAPASDSNAVPLGVEVMYDRGGGPERFRSDFAAALVTELRSRGCYPSILDRPEPGALLFRVVLEAPLQEQLNDLSLPGSLRNEQEMGAASTTYKTRIYAGLEIHLPEPRELFRGKRLRGETSYRPTFAWEDGAAESRDELIRGFASQVAGFACKADNRKLRRKLAERSP
jgi:hypothetical protein